MSDTVSKGRIVEFSGAGISVAAGLKAFRCPSRMNKATTRANLDANSLVSPGARSAFLKGVRMHAMYHVPEGDTMFHRLLDHVAWNGTLLHSFTQNINGFDNTFSSLPGRTTFLHGWLDQLRCEKVEGHTVPYNPPAAPEIGDGCAEWVDEARPGAGPSRERAAKKVKMAIEEPRAPPEGIAAMKRCSSPACGHLALQRAYGRRA